MKSLGLAQIFCSYEAENRTQRGALWRIFCRSAGKKMRQDGVAEAISDS